MKPTRLYSSNHLHRLTFTNLAIKHHLVTPNYSTITKPNADSHKQTIQHFKQTHRSGTKPHPLTYASLFKSCASLSALQLGQQIQVDCFKHGLDSDVYVSNTMIHFYSSCKKITHARQVFDEMPHRSVVSWNTIISALFRASWLNESLECFISMREVNVDPDETTVVVMVSLCAKLGNLALGKCVHGLMVKEGFEITCRVGTALVNMYAKCGDLSSASLVFDKMSERNVWTWSAMILGLAQHGCGSHAIVLFNKMKDGAMQANMQPNHVTFLGVICACSHAGYVEDAYRFFNEMKCVYGMTPQLPHYGAMVDVLGRAGRLTEAYDFAVNMPIVPDATVWRTLLGACNVHSGGDCDGVGEKVEKKLLELEPRWGGNLVMVANKYAEGCKWEDVEQVRKGMRFKRVKKMAGESCIEVKGFTVRLLSGFDSRDSCVDVYLLLDGLNLNMKIDNTSYYNTY